MSLLIGQFRPDSRHPGRIASGLAAVGTTWILLGLMCGAALAAEGAQGKEKKPPAKPPAGNPAPLSFTDVDLEKYHQPRTESAHVFETDDAEEDAALPPAAGQGTKPKPAQHATDLRRSAPKAAKPPADDPLKPFKDREAREGFRQDQLRTLRGRIGTLQARLEYLTRFAQEAAGR